MYVGDGLTPGTMSELLLSPAVHTAIEHALCETNLEIIGAREGYSVPDPSSGSTATLARCIIATVRNLDGTMFTVVVTRP